MKEPEICDECGGSGHDEKNSNVFNDGRCPKCYGKGNVKEQIGIDYSFVKDETTYHAVIPSAEYDRLKKIEAVTREYYEKATADPLSEWSINFSDVCDYLNKLTEVFK